MKRHVKYLKKLLNKIKIRRMLVLGFQAWCFLNSPPPIPKITGGIVSIDASHNEMVSSGGTGIMLRLRDELRANLYAFRRSEHNKAMDLKINLDKFRPVLPEYKDRH